MNYPKEYKIINYPNDVYAGIGELIKLSQEWEKEYKDLVKLLKLKVKNVDNSSLNKLNQALKKRKIITEKEFENLEKVIKVRNYVNHGFFLEGEYFFRAREEIEDFFNKSYLLICDATDIITNKIDEVKGNAIKRPTIFDEINA